MRTDDLYSLPENLPVPEDDGACDHLRGSMIPSIGLKATSRSIVDLSKEGRPWLVVYCYPLTGRPDREPPGGIAAWNAIPGARGCTPQSCSYRNHFAELTSLGATVYGLSTQDTEYQAEAVQRLHLPFALLSDAQLDFTEGHELVQRGPYRLVRHPIYTGLVAMFLATVLVLGYVGGIVGLVLVFVSFWIKLSEEEKIMLKQFSDQYVDYQQRVKRIIPFVL
jgi:peroxiredoxin